jgi:hypothetical protein
MIAAERLYLTAERDALVREGDPDGAFLYAAPGDEIPDSAVERFGLVDGRLSATPVIDAAAVKIAADEAARLEAEIKAKADADAAAQADVAADAAKEAAPGDDKEAKPGKTKGD